MIILYSLIKCCHTFCSECVANPKLKNCPICKEIIEEARPNFTFLKHTKESEYDIKKQKLNKSINELELLKQKFENETKPKQVEHIQELVRSIKIKVEKQSNELIKEINRGKKKLLNKIDKKAANINKLIGDLELEDLELNLKETKDNLNNDKYQIEDLEKLDFDIFKSRCEFNSNNKNVFIKLYETLEYDPFDDYNPVGLIKQTNYFEKGLELIDPYVKDSFNLTDEKIIDEEIKVIKAYQNTLNFFEVCLNDAIKCNPDLEFAYYEKGNYIKYLIRVYRNNLAK